MAVSDLTPSVRLFSGIIALSCLLLSGFMGWQLYNIGVLNVGRGLGGLIIAVLAPIGFGIVFLHMALTGSAVKLDG